LAVFSTGLNDEVVLVTLVEAKQVPVTLFEVSIPDFVLTEVMLTQIALYEVPIDPVQLIADVEGVIILKRELQHV
jgi:hypothetical protein